MRTLGESGRVEDFDQRRAEQAKLLLAQLPHHAVHMDGRQAADFGEVGLRQRERETAAVAKARRKKPRVGFAQKMRDAPRRIEAAEPKQPRAVDRRVEQGRKPQLADQLRHFLCDRLDLGMRDGRDRRGRQRRDIMVEHLERKGVEI